MTRAAATMHTMGTTSESGRKTEGRGSERAGRSDAERLGRKNERMTTRGNVADFIIIIIAFFFIGAAVERMRPDFFL